METEPTAEERQRQAFGYLRSHARNAHIAGDGLLVGVLCHTGLQRLDQLAKENKLLLPFSDVVWMPILALYWLIDPNERHSIESTIKTCEHRTDEDRLVKQWFDRYWLLIEQPLAGDAQLSPALKDFAWPIAFTERSPEAEVLISHMVELAWFHDPNSENWKELATTWLSTAPVWSHQMLHGLRTRLELQTRLTSPKNTNSLFPESDVNKLRENDAIAELWLLHLHGRSAAVCEAAERLAPFLSAESQRWRVLHDFIHFDSIYGAAEDSQGVRIARRRRLSVETPLLVFHDERESRLTKTLGELFRARSMGAASKRWDIYLIACLHELSALRLWDYGMWLEAIRAQAQANLEVVQWTNAHPELSAHGLAQAVRSFSSNSPDKDPTIRRAIDTLEFAPTEVLEGLGESLLATYPKQKYSAASLLKDLTDLLPPTTWTELAHWTISYIKESSENRTSGMQLAPATHWRWVLTTLPCESPVWATLEPEALRMAKITHCWRGEFAAFLAGWLLFAPRFLAREVAEAMTNHPETSANDCIARAELLVKFEEWNPSLSGTYTNRLFPIARSESEALILARHLKLADLAAREESLRLRVIQNIRQAIARAAPPPDINIFNFSYIVGIDLVSQWKPEDQQLVDELIATVKSPNVLIEYLSWLLQTVQLMVANGPKEFAELVQPYVIEWARRLPHGRKAIDTESGPLSIVQFNNGGNADIALSLGWLAFQLPKKLGSKSHAAVLTWAREMLLMGESKPLDMAIYGSAVVALQTPEATSAEPLAIMETAILSLWVRADHDAGAMLSLANALNKIASLVDSEHFKSSADKELPLSTGVFVAVFSRFIPRFAKSPQASLRAAIAALLWQLEAHGIREPWVIESLKSLQKDHRARVRFEAQGGWKNARSRAIDRDGE